MLPGDSRARARIRFLCRFHDLYLEPQVRALFPHVRPAQRQAAQVQALRDSATLGEARILQVFGVSKIGKVAGCLIQDGRVERGASVRLIRDNVVIHEGKLSTLKRFKDEVKEVGSGQECGMAFERYEDIRQGDVIEIFEREEVERRLA